MRFIRCFPHKPRSQDAFIKRAKAQRPRIRYDRFLPAMRLLRAILCLARRACIAPFRALACLGSKRSLALSSLALPLSPTAAWSGRLFVYFAHKCVRASLLSSHSCPLSPSAHRARHGGQRRSMAPEYGAPTPTRAALLSRQALALYIPALRRPALLLLSSRLRHMSVNTLALTIALCAR